MIAIRITYQYFGTIARMCSVIGGRNRALMHQPENFDW